MSGSYEIRVRHRVGPEVMHLLDDLQPVLAEDSTIFHTDGVDQPTLYGALGRLADLGLDIASVERIDAAE